MEWARMNPDTSTGTRPFRVTLFEDVRAQTLEQREMEIWNLRDLALTTTSDSKEKLPLFTLTTFGDLRNANNCVRFNANALNISGVVVDYDGEKMPPEEAFKRLRDARVSALLYTSPRHCEARPRWRVVAPTSCDLNVSEHAKLVARINDVLGGVLAGESFNISQSYYLGKLNGNPAHIAKYTTGEFIDLRDELDAAAIYKRSKSKLDNIELTDSAGVQPSTPITSLDDRRLKNLSVQTRSMIETAAPPANRPELKGGRGHCRVVGELINLGLNNAQIKAVYRLGKIAIGPTHSSRGFDGYIERVIAVCRATHEEKTRKKSQRDVGNEGVSLDDFYAFMPMHSYIYAPSREPWPGSSVNARVHPVPLCDAHGQPVLDDDGKQKLVSASAWLDRNRPVEQMTWAPGLPMIIRNRLISQGGWIERNDVSCFNLYREPMLKLGNPNKAGPWLDHVRKVFGDDAEHIVRWLAHRVQHPDEKINHALVLGGAQGIGKDTALEPVKRAVGPWNFCEVSPQHMLGRFNGFLKSVILRVNEARDLGDVNRFQFYDHMKAYTAAPPDVLRVDEKNLREYAIINCVGVIITTNHKADGIYLPADDRRHFVAWSDLTKENFSDDYWVGLWHFYDHGGDQHIAAYLADLDLSEFDPKAPPPKTPAFWDIVDANRAPEDAELADVLDDLQRPDVVTLATIKNHVPIDEDFKSWLNDPKNRRVIPHRMETCGYVRVRNDAAKDGLWKIAGKRQSIYARGELSIRDQIEAASSLAAAWK